MFWGRLNIRVEPAHKGWRHGALNWTNSSDLMSRVSNNYDESALHSYHKIQKNLQRVINIRRYYSRKLGREPMFNSNNSSVLSVMHNDGLTKEIWSLWEFTIVKRVKSANTQLFILLWIAKQSHYPRRRQYKALVESGNEGALENI